MAKTKLVFRDGFDWTHEGNISFKGYVFNSLGAFLRGREALSLFRGIATAESLKKRLKQLDGLFTIIIRSDAGTLLGVDAMSMFSLYYAYHDGQWWLSDSSMELRRHLPSTTFNQSTLPGFLSAGFVPGRECLIHGIFKTQAAEVLLLKPTGRMSVNDHYSFFPEGFSADSEISLGNDLKSILEHVAERLISSLQDQTAVIPLSGGYDSRLIACMLKKAGYENVICFTYGRPNRESEISELVARALGYQWVFVDYRDLDAVSYLREESFKKYCDYAGNATSMPFLQEYFAAKHLKEHNIIPSGSVFIPGHTGDYLAGSYVEKTIRRRPSEKSRPEALVSKYFRFIELASDEKKNIAQRIQDWFDTKRYPAMAKYDQYDVFAEDWDLKEKFSKFVFNAAKVYPFFGYEIRLPLWDKEFRNFFRKLPFAYRSYKSLYDAVIEEKYFKPQHIYFGAEELKETASSLKRQRLRELVRSFVPFRIRKKRMISRDYICYQRFTKEMARQIEQEGESVPKRINHFNAIICQWYALQVKKMLRK